MAFDLSILKNPWVLGGIVVGGAVLAFVVLPRLTGGSSGAASSSSTSGDTAATDTGTGGATPQITYEIVQGQYTPVGASAGTAVSPTTPPGSGPQIVPPPPDPTPNLPPPATQPAPVSPATPPQRPKQFVSPSAWPNRQSTLRGISQAHGVALSAIESFPENQYIKSRGGGWNSTIYTTDKIRIA